MESIYESIAKRTGGNVYIGVVGPVRTGKSTLIKRIMEVLVIPGITEPCRAERARDELPQSGSGKTIMTAEPKFVPEEAVEISPDGRARVSVRMIDTVGYMVEGAVGAMEDGKPRMVTTPWFDREIPMTEAAELGTKKVMEGHCTVGLVVTTDGTVTDISREDYVAAEKRAVADMKATGKPFLVVVNSRNPNGEAAKGLLRELTREFGIRGVCADCLNLGEEEISEMLRQLLYTFPMEQLEVWLPKWLDALEPDHPMKTAIYEALVHSAERIGNLGSAEAGLEAVGELPEVSELRVKDMDLSTGTVRCSIALPEGVYYEILSSKAGMEIRDDAQLLQLLTDLAAVKRDYEKLSDAIASVQATGYGVVMPTAEEMKLETPELVRRGGSYGVKLKAGAPSIHMMRVDIDTEISPMVGDEKQSRELIAYLQGENPEKLWESNIFGKSVYAMIQEGLTAKLVRMPEEVRGRFRGTLTRIVNDGAAGLICIIL